MNVAIVSDAHIPSRATEIPDSAKERLRDADHVICAGDFDSTDGYARFVDLAPRMTAVAGNTDPRSLDLPDVATVELEGVTFVVTHGDGLARYAMGLADLAEREAPDADRLVAVAGHTHDVLDERVQSVRIVNPGSVTGAAPARRATLCHATVANGEIDLDLVELD
ncbi:metallophosphoesterase family protein [Halococcoides cellulosivorans]|uniref:Phosphoesterase n=1 Tax=Halococcoides cellulosivorans TaxID=1679096 RepID=A0A2R4X093_9EURY|nr:metallophosphoesterase family protein [Halococcoides cellulosivorans]AWB27216.1 YfcE family phosphodiesterase [Halococcoides cellulosivorans]